MSCSVVTGKLGTGKSLSQVELIRVAVQAGLSVATNLDIYIEHLVPANCKGTITRLPDKPRPSDFYALGTGDGLPYDGVEYDESKFGLIVLDECATWLNSRSWQDSERNELLEFMIHARKYRWNVNFIIQNVKSIDKQLKDSLVEYLIISKRLNKIPIPIINTLTKVLIGKNTTLPDLHLQIKKLGLDTHAVVVDRNFYRSKNLYPAYRTGQVFTHDELVTKDGEVIDMRAPYTFLSAYHMKGRYEPTTMQKIIKALNKIIFLIDTKIVKGSSQQAQRPRDEPQTILVREILHIKDSAPVVIW